MAMKHTEGRGDWSDLSDLGLRLRVEGVSSTERRVPRRRKAGYAFPCESEVGWLVTAALGSIPGVEEEVKEFHGPAYRETSEVQVYVDGDGASLGDVRERLAAGAGVRFSPGSRSNVAIYPGARCPDEQSRRNIRRVARPEGL